MKKINLWSENICIRAYMVDTNREANLVAIQNLCQEVASNHANACELGYEAMQKRGMAWVLNRLKINILKQPKWTETVTVKTWVSMMQPFSHRHFQIVLPVSETHSFLYHERKSKRERSLPCENAFFIKNQFW